MYMLDIYIYILIFLNNFNINYIFISLFYIFKNIFNSENSRDKLSK